MTDPKLTVEPEKWGYYLRDGDDGNAVSFIDIETLGFDVSPQALIDLIESHRPKPRFFAKDDIVYEDHGDGLVRGVVDAYDYDAERIAAALNAYEATEEADQ